MCVVFSWCSELREHVAGRLSWLGSSSFCGISRDIDLVRLDLPSTTCLLRARTGSCRQFERARDLIERCLFRFAHRDAADAKKSAFLGGLGNVLADLAQPAFEGRCIARRLAIDYRTSLPQRLDALGFDLGGLAACELLLQAVARGPSPLGSLKVGDHCFDQRVSPGVHLGRHQRVALGEALFQKAPQTAGLGLRSSPSAEAMRPIISGVRNCVMSETRLTAMGLPPLSLNWEQTFPSGASEPTTESQRRCCARSFPEA